MGAIERPAAADAAERLFLPPVWVEKDETWKLVADVELARFLRDVPNRNERRRRLETVLEEAHEEAVPLRSVDCVSRDKTVADVARSMTDVPVLIIDDEDKRQPLGIVTAFDLL